jgi:hypothetical protein
MLNLTPSQMFKVGFLLRCADEGLSDEETAERVAMAERYVKQAGVGDAIQGTASGGSATLQLLRSLGLWGLVGGGLLGGIGGYAGGVLTDEPTDPSEVKKQELVAAYQQHADRARRQAANTQYRSAVPRKPSLSLV